MSKELPILVRLCVGENFGGCRRLFGNGFLSPEDKSSGNSFFFSRDGKGLDLTEGTFWRVWLNSSAPFVDVTSEVEGVNLDVLLIGTFCNMWLNGSDCFSKWDVWADKFNDEVFTATDDSDSNNSLPDLVNGKIWLSGSSMGCVKSTEFAGFPVLLLSYKQNKYQQLKIKTNT